MTTDERNAELVAALNVAADHVATMSPRDVHAVFGTSPALRSCHVPTDEGAYEIGRVVAARVSCASGDVAWNHDAKHDTTRNAYRAVADVVAAWVATRSDVGAVVVAMHAERWARAIGGTS